MRSTQVVHVCKSAATVLCSCHLKMLHFCIHYDIVEGDTPSPIAYSVPAIVGLAYCIPPFFWPRVLRTVYQQKKQFWAFPFT